MESVAVQQVKIMPDVLIQGSSDGSQGAISGLLGMQILKQLGKKMNNGDDSTQAN